MSVYPKSLPKFFVHLTTAALAFHLPILDPVLVLAGAGMLAVRGAGSARECQPGGGACRDILL